MSTSNFTIDSVEYELNIQEITDDSPIILNEKKIIPDCTDFSTPASILFGTGYQRRKIIIKGYTTETNKSIFKQALENATDIYPEIYPPTSSDNITENTIYKISKFDCTYNLGNGLVWYNMEITFFMSTEDGGEDGSTFGYGDTNYGDAPYGL